VFKTLSDLDAPPHPGELLREDILPKAGLGPRELARHLDVAPSVVDELLAETRPVTLDLALRLGVALGQGARYWLGQQMLYDLWQAEQPAQRPARVTPVVWTKRSADARSARRPAAA